MSKNKKDLLELCRDFFPDFSDKELKGMIACGEVSVRGETIRDPRRKLQSELVPVIKRPRYVSRGGEKLEHAIRMFGLEPAGKVFVDAGSSTGGFTDCLLKNGARYVHSVDVGYNQLDYSLRIDPRVNVLERCNIMSVQNLDPRPDYGVADLSFRSISGAASHIIELAAEGIIIALVKPQFEIVSEEGFDGIIRDHEKAVEVAADAAERLESEGVFVLNAVTSPIKGAKGNTEFLFLLGTVKPADGLSNAERVRKTVD